MKIALVIERMDPSRGGREMSTAQIASGLAARGHDVTILCQQAAWEDATPVRIRAFGAKGQSRSDRLRLFVADVQDQIRRETCDIVHAMLPLPGANVYQPRGGTMPAQARASLRRRRGLDRLLARVGRSFDLFRRQLAFLEYQVVRDERVGCLCVSRMVADELEQFYHRTENVRVIYNAVALPDVDADRRRQWREQTREQLSIPASAVALLSAATNPVLKGVGEAIEAFARWQSETETEGHLVLLVPDDGKYAAQARRLGVGDRVHLVGLQRDIWPWLAATDLCVLLSWYDPCSRLVLEATRWGIPSITTRFNGAAEVLESGGGIVVDSPAAIEAVAGGMAELARADAQTRAQAACREVAAGLSMDRHIDECLDAYREIARS